MTADEAIERIKTMAFMCDDFHNCKYGHDCTDGCSEAVKMAVDALQGSVKKKHIGSDNMVISSSDLMTILNGDIEEMKQYKEVGTVEEFKAFKENQCKCEDCAGCTNWKCDCANERDYAINEFANFLHKKAKENNGLRLSSETRSWTHPCIFDYLKEFKEEQICKEET